MASFSEADVQGTDWTLFQNGWVTMYLRPAILESDCAWLTNHGYRMHRLEAGRWSTEADALRDFGDTLSFPSYYGQSLDALNDCLSDLEVPIDGGVAIVLLRYDLFATRQAATAHAILDVLCRNARQHMLFGRRLAILVQSDDPELSFSSLAPTHSNWNRREWLNKNRGPERVV